MNSPTIRPMTADDWPAVRDIYAAGIATGNATFETAAPAWDGWDRSHLAEHRLVAVDLLGSVIGWTALSPVSDRCAYAGVVEHSVYVDPGHRRAGVGRSLLDALIASTEAAGIWTIQTGIFPENAASVALHQRAGFRVIGRRERIGRLHGRWRDSLLLERRSTVTGTDGPPASGRE
jgi:L-amino acid N-acyltransferase YncA